MENFDRSQLLVIDGTDMLTDPSKWVKRAQVLLKGPRGLKPKRCSKFVKRKFNKLKSFTTKFNKV